MLIKYNESNVHAFPYVNAEALKRLKGPSKRGDKPIIQSPQDVVSLKPGWNEFPKAVWDQNKDHPAIKKMLKRGKIELMSHKAKVRVRGTNGKVKLVERVIGADDKPIRLKHFDIKMAVKLVKGTLNRDMLQRWLDEERRHLVKKALRKQIKPLLPGKSDDDEDDIEEEEFD